MAITAPDTCSIDLMAALIGDSFSSDIKRSTFSNTTIASSTTIPIESTIAKRVNVLIEKPNIHKPANVPINEIGTAINGIKVARQLCKNKNTTSTTNTIASPSVFTTSMIEDLTKSLVSYGTSQSTPSGNLFLSSAIFSLMAFAVSSEFAPVCKNIGIPTPGRPSNAVRTL